MSRALVVGPKLITDLSKSLQHASCNKTLSVFAECLVRVLFPLGSSRWEAVFRLLIRWAI